VIVAKIRSLNQSIRDLDQSIAEEGSTLWRHKNLTSIGSRWQVSGFHSLLCVSFCVLERFMNRIASAFVVLATLIATAGAQASLKADLMDLLR